MTAIAYARFRPAEQSSVQVATYSAFRQSELRAMLAEVPDGGIVAEECDLDLPPEVVQQLRSQLAAPIKRMAAMIGTVSDGVWVTGPLEGQAGPACTPDQP